MRASATRIPHLARAIAEKQGLCRVVRSSQFLAPYQPQQKLSRCRNVSQYSVPRPPQKQIRPLPPTASAPPATRKILPPERGRPDFGFEQNAAPRRSVRDKAFLIPACAFGLLVAGYVGYVVLSYQQDVKAYSQGPQLEQDADVSDRWKIATRDFDHEVDWQEKWTWLKPKRRRLVREAYGDVLEVSVGTGRNMDFYDTRPYSATESASYGRDTRHMITSLTFNDQSEVMIDNAKRKWELSQSKKRSGDRFSGDVNFVLGDAGRPGVLKRPPGGYDTIIQSFGVCSMADPVGFLKQMGRLARQPGEKVVNASSKRLREEEDADGRGGRIFLLEHGRASPAWAWLNGYIDQIAPIHADRYGCWFNKDIGHVIEESGLVVERIKKYQLGTVWEVVLRPAPVTLHQDEVTESASDQPPRRNWMSLLGSSTYPTSKC